VVKKHLLHGVEGVLGNVVFYLFLVDAVLAELHDLEGDLMEDSLSQFLDDRLLLAD
jgi:hypothetical protein